MVPLPWDDDFLFEQEESDDDMLSFSAETLANQLRMISNQAYILRERIYREGYWIDASYSIIKAEDLDDAHLLNILRLLYRRKEKLSPAMGVLQQAMVAIAKERGLNMQFVVASDKPKKFYGELWDVELLGPGDDINLSIK